MLEAADLEEELEQIVFHHRTDQLTAFELIRPSVCSTKKSLDFAGQRSLRPTWET